MKYYLIQIKEWVYHMKLGDYDNNEISPVLYERGEFSDKFQFIPYAKDIKNNLDIYAEPNTSMIVVSKRLKELLTFLEIPLISFFDLRFYEGEESKHAPRDKFTLVLS